MSNLYSFYCRFLSFFLIAIFSCTPSIAGSSDDESPINEEDMAFHRPLNILIIGEPGVGKSKLASSILRNTRRTSRPSVNLKMPENGIAHNRIIAAEYNRNVRIIEMNVDEFSKLDSDSTEVKYLILHTTWVLYVVNETNCRVDKMLSVYDKINECYCKNYKINYDNYSIYQSKEWFINLKRAMHIGDQLFCGFTLIANVENKNLDKYLIENYKEMANGRKVFYVNYNGDKFVPPIPSDLIDLLDEYCDVTVISKTPWSHSLYLQDLCFKIWKQFVDCFVCCKDTNILSYHYDTPQFIKNQQRRGCSII